jgi:C-terminal processing protease CtpA/Prc
MKYLIFLFLCFACSQASNQADERRTDSEADKLYKLCKVWGFVKYHTPEGVDFDEELFKLLDYSEKSDDKIAFDKRLCDWVKSVNQHNKIAESKPVCECAVRVSFDWTKDSLLLGSDLVKELSITERSVFETNRYVYLGDGLFPKFPEEKKYEQDTLPNKKLSLLALFRYWNIIEYCFPYRYTISDWDEALKDLIPHFLFIKNRAELILNLKMLAARTNDGHAFFVNTTNSEIFDKHFGDRLIPLFIENVQGKYIVTDYLDSSAKLKPIIEKGDEILKLYDIPVDSLIKSIMPYTSGSNMNYKINRALFQLIRTFDKKVNVTYSRNGKTDTVTIESVPPNLASINAYHWNKVESFPEFSFLRNDVGYLFLGNLSASRMPAVMKKFQNTKAIIIDLRHYPKDKRIVWYSKYFVEHSDFFFDFFHPHPSCAGCFTFKNEAMTELVKDIIKVDKIPVYQGKVFVLVNYDTMSAGELCVMALQSNPEIKVIGNQTAGSIGAVTIVPLPLGIEIYMSGFQNRYPDGTEVQHAGVKIDYEVYPDIKSIQEGRDVYIEKALELIDAEK